MFFGYLLKIWVLVIFLVLNELNFSVSSVILSRIIHIHNNYCNNTFTQYIWDMRIKKNFEEQASKIQIILHLFVFDTL